ncbi:MAG TPA: enoyl-CoA hydratase/isomerase family protein [Pseudorhodoferax sp.]|nr:enoyl-CoA hydratase/isomerase family protein [Pseudorhodoferax sp.]
MDIQTENLRASQLRIQSGIAELSHQRPERRNALSPELQQDYADLVERIDATPDIRVLLITGSGGSFSAGGDVKFMRERLHDPAVATADYMRNRLRRSHQWLTRLRELAVPVVAAVDGPAYGAGFGLALQADFVLASTRAVFCASFARLGAVPDFGLLHTLPRAVGLSRAKELMLTARRLGAREALAWGLVHAVHADEALLPEARAFAARLCQGPREAAGLTKALVNRSFETDCAAMFAAEAGAQALAMQTPYHAQAVAAFARDGRFAYDWDRLVEQQGVSQ